MTRGFLLVLLLTGCNAGFTDLRPEGSTPGLDAGPVDLGPPPSTDTVRARGMWGGRGSYPGEGEVTIVQRTNGDLEVVMSDDFRTGSVPGPVVVLSVRDALGTNIDVPKGDIEIGPLQATSGGQTYAAPGNALTAQYAWIFCKPFGVEISRATLMEVQ